MQRTLMMIKPDAVAAGHTGAILAHVEKAGFRIAGMKKLHLSRLQAETFYAVHRERKFFGELVEFMTEGPIIAACLEAEDAVKLWRDVMGATNPAEAAEGTIRKLYGTDIGRNATHGSDSGENAVIETAFFFSGLELVG